VKGYAAKMTDAQLESVRSNPLISYIERDQMMYANDCADIRTAGTWGQTRVAEKAKVVYNDQYSSPNHGADTFLYVVDTGVYVDNQDFTGRATFAFKATPTWSDKDGNGHGTHVASISAGHKYGIANKATVFAVKVLGDDGSGTNAGVIAGVDFAVGDAVKRGAKKCVLNLSLGGGRSTTLNAAVNNGVAADVVVIVAAGNDNGDACAGSPSSAIDVITVGSTEQSPTSQKDARSWFSNWGPCVDIFAPGTSITAAWIGTPTSINTISGTSMASPNVAGVSLLLRHQFPTLGAKTINDMLKETATPDIVNLLCSGGTCTGTPNLFVNNGCNLA